jgi:colicin import membrane protein
MDKTTHYVYSSELYHYGRKGMKWGQNIFGKKRSGAKGTVVAKKKKSYLERAKEAKEAKKKAAAEAKAKAAEEARKKDPKNMTDDDIRKAIARKKLENEYRQYYPAKVSKGKEFMKKFVNESLTPALISSGKKIMGDVLDAYGKSLVNKYFPEEVSEQTKLERKVAKAKAEYELADYKAKKKKAESDSPSDLETQAKNAGFEKIINDALKTKYEAMSKEEDWNNKHKESEEANKKKSEENKKKKK